MVTEPGRALRPPTANPRPGGVPGGGRFPGRIRPGNVPPPATGFASKAHVVRAPFQVAREVGGRARRAKGARRPGPPGRSAARILSRGRPELTHTLPPPVPSIMALFPGANGSVDLTGPRPAARRAARAALAAPWGTQKPVLEVLKPERRSGDPAEPGGPGPGPGRGVTRAS